MNKQFLFLLLLLLSVALLGCGAETAAPEGPGTAAVSTAADVTVDREALETEPKVEGTLFLRASSVAMTLVGDTEELYIGTVPMEAVTWESDDESVAVFSDGVLTATGVGNTTVRAVCQDQVVECAVSCLAENREALAQIDEAILRSPKRLPPVVDMEEPCTDFAEAAIIGDSITYFMFQWETKYDYLGEVTFLARGGVSLNGFVGYFKNIYYRGHEMHLEDAIAQSGVKKIYVMLGQNDLTSKARVKIMDNWVILLDRIREKCPDVEIYLQSCIPELSEDDELNEKNQRIFDYNDTLHEFGRENGCKFIDLEYYITDHQGKLPYEYSQGNYHMNETGCYTWMQILRFYAQLEKEGGDLT